MKKLLFLLISVGLISCNSSNFKEATEETALPVKVIKSLEDTLSFDKFLVSCNGTVYIIQKTDKKPFVSEYIEKENDNGLVFWLGFVIGIIFIIIIAGWLDI